MHLFTKIVEKEVEVVRVETIKDPNGLIRGDIELLERQLNLTPYKVGDSIESVAYRQGQQDMLALIKRLFGGRT